ncbi:MAG: 1-deoxy-D-xylulose-5-phosphate reductoisomerase [Deltaproteobacteria bacterium]|nr:1-deoxy-D-xylulose-5-phosphate reductoisomerase [Deltaproteobacteria bacterium]
MKNISILGSTGSIGVNTINIIRMFPEEFKVKVLTAKNNIKLLADQIIEFAPELAVVYEEKNADMLVKLLPAGLKTEIIFGKKGYKKAASYSGSDIVISSMVGAAGLVPTIAAIKAGKNVALANKETLVMAGEIITKPNFAKRIKIFPIDSEHSAIFQSLAGHKKEELTKIILTASGGPFRKLPRKKFNSITPDEALNHPTWSMGKKISIDSATLMNKGLEIIEAKWLFGINEDKIEVLIHPQSIIHSMVEFIDGSVIAQLGNPDMKTAISYALSYPKRLPIKQTRMDLAKIGSLSFETPNFDKFLCLRLAYEALKEGGLMPTVLNAANEIAVEAFLNKKTDFLSIPKIIEKTMLKYNNKSLNGNIEQILEADVFSREIASSFIGVI